MSVKEDSPYRRARDGSSGDDSVEDGCGRPWVQIQTRISRGWPYEDNGSVEGRRYPVRSTCLGNRFGVGVDGLWRLERLYKMAAREVREEDHR
ncbi:hypothetical protein DPMN_096820 [Dreissena polymorpha]|uniref:Uncharacterized protein n=1 Tax=Dreissena polymorpha TaxID=45954 RepID=A0A9D4LAI5_DREPO|nr:hypothetical protein DPMN_096820 [Dreissena polymorpha]